MLERPRHSVDEVVQAHGRLRRRGQQWEGPCPVCGGKDRFHVNIKPKPDGTALIGCRGDGTRQHYAAIMRELFPKDNDECRSRAPRSDHRRAGRIRARRETPPPVVNSPKSDLVASIWASTVVADRTPGRLYLACRHAWPPLEIGPDLPVDVRWLDHSEAPPVNKALDWPGMPPNIAGALVFAWRRPKSRILTALSFEALTGDGRRLDQVGRRRWRITHGNRRGAVFETRSEDGGPIHLVEGEIDALAAVLLPGFGPGTIRAVGGTSGFSSAAAPERRPVVLHPDPDPSNPKAAMAAQRAKTDLQAERRECAIAWGKPDYGDLADRLAEIVRGCDEHADPERAAIREFDGGVDPVSEAWAEVLSREASNAF